MHQLLFIFFYLGLLPAIFTSPFAGVLLYNWLDWLPPDAVYSNTLLPDFLSFLVGALAFLMWILREKKSLPHPLTVPALMAGYLIWTNVTWQFALVPAAGYFHWDRTIKVIGFSILTAQMLSSRRRLEAYTWTFLLAVIYYSVPSAIKVMVAGGSGGIGAGDVVSSEGGGFFGDRVILSVVMSMAIPLALYVGRYPTMLPEGWRPWAKPAMLGVVLSLLIALIGTFARTAVFAGGATLLMLTVRSRRKISALFGVAAAVALVYLIAPENWFDRMQLITDYQTDGSAMGRIAAWKWAWGFALQHPIVGGGFGVFVLDAGHITGKPGWEEAHNIFFEVMGEHGFVGLGIFCGLIVAIYRSCAAVQKRVRDRTELAWAADLARAVQIALVAFVVGGMFVSIASAPYLYMLGAMTIGVRGLVERELRAAEPRSVSRPTRTMTRPAYASLLSKNG
jgi:putative inorganic carbon (hco3(-)) transporter